MDRRTMLAASVVLAAGAVAPAMAAGGPGLADVAAPVESRLQPLPAPQTSGGKPLYEALAQRRSQREFSPRELPITVLANLLWAANGINRPESGKRTAPSCLNWQEIELYALTASGVLRYAPKEHALERVSDKDLRALSGRQPFVAGAPLNLVLVADYARMPGVSAEDRLFYSGTDTGLVSQNVYLFCASEGLATVVRANLDKQALARAMGLGPEQHITLVQTVGYPKG